MYSQDAPDTMGTGDRRITANTMPSAMPMTIARTVSSSVTRRPCTIELVVKYCRTTPHSKFLFVDTAITNKTNRNNTTTVATHRPGRLRGMALTGGGAARSSPADVDGSTPVLTPSARRSVDARRAQDATPDPVLVEDLLERPVGVELLQRVLHRRRLPVALRDRHAVEDRSGVVPGEPKLPVRLPRLVLGDLGVG